MTAQQRAEGERKAQIEKEWDCNFPQDDRLHPPEALDDRWWTSILESEPQIKNLRAEEDPAGEEQLLAERAPVPSTINWNKVDSLYKNDEIVAIQVVGFNRGGILVEGEYIRGFISASHLVDLPSNTTKKEQEQYFHGYLGREVSLKIIECDPQKDRIVFSERAALAGAGKRKKLLHSLAEGDIVSGIVTNITNFGVFVDLGGLEGLIHISELSWGRVSHPSVILKLGDKVETMVVNVSLEQARVALSLKQLAKNPWDNLTEKISPGDVLDAIITRIVKYGVFARLEIGIEGLIHISTIAFPATCEKIGDFLFEGQVIKVGVLSLDPKERRLGLILKGN